MRALIAFCLGLREFRSAVTTHFDDDELLTAYEWGREVAHRITGRRWD